MLWLIQEFLLTLFVELFGVACTAGVIFVCWNVLAK